MYKIKDKSQVCCVVLIIINFLNTCSCFIIISQRRLSLLSSDLADILSKDVTIYFDEND